MTATMTAETHVCGGCGGSFPLGSSTPGAGDGLFSHDCENDAVMVDRLLHDANDASANVDPREHGAGGGGGSSASEPASQKALDLLTALVRCSTVTITRRDGGDLADVEGIVAAAVEAIGTGKKAVARAIDKLKAGGATPTWRPVVDVAATPSPEAEQAPVNVRPNRYAGSCARCHGHVAESAGTIDKLNGRWIVQHVGACPPAAAEPVGVLDLSPLPEGRYGVPGSDSRLKVQVDKPTSGRYAGNVYVKDAAEYGHGRRYGRQLAGELYAGQIVDELQAILADPRAAAAKYGELTGRCGICNRQLEDEESVRRGIGPVCARKVGWA